MWGYRAGFCEGFPEGSPIPLLPRPSPSEVAALVEYQSGEGEGSYCAGTIAAREEESEGKCGTALQTPRPVRKKRQELLQAPKLRFPAQGEAAAAHGGPQGCRNPPGDPTLEQGDA